jgi:hypothetical protein
LEFIDESSEFNLNDYLNELIDIYPLVLNNQINIEDSIKYAWEADKTVIDQAKKVMKETNVLIIIGYSFPSFNREIDSMLISEFEKNNLKWVVYQDPQSNLEIVESLFRDPKIVTIERENIQQFHIPHEFLFPNEGEEFIF